MLINITIVANKIHNIEDMVASSILLIKIENAYTNVKIKMKNNIDFFVFNFIKIPAKSKIKRYQTDYNINTTKIPYKFYKCLNFIYKM